jgi:hypothetical protein
VSLRPFHFLLYLSEGGRIYVGSQYLGQFGGYGALQNALRNFLNDPDEIFSHSFRVGASSYAKAAAKEVRVSFSSHNASIAANSTFTQSGMIAFKKASSNDGFEQQVSNRFLSLIGLPRNEVKKAVAALLNESDLMDVKDTDIEDCTVLASVNGHRKVIYLMESGSFASRFPIDVPIDDDGHPKFAETRAAMIKSLKDEIISRQKDE